MHAFYAQLSATPITTPITPAPAAAQSVVGNLMTTLAALTRLSRTEVRHLAKGNDWDDWGN